MRMNAKTIDWSVSDALLATNSGRRGGRILTDARCTSYAQIEERARHLASGFASLEGVFKEERVAVLSHGRDTSFLLMFAAAFSGLVLVPLNTRWGLQETRHALDNCRPCILVFDASFLSRVEDLEDGKSNSFHLVTTTYISPRFLSQEQLELHPISPKLPRTVATNAFAIFYTSGTSGKPKGVALSHHSLLVQGYAKMVHVGYSPSTVYLHLVPLFHVGGASSAIAVTMAGGSHVMPISNTFDPDEVLQLVAKHSVTAFAVVPAMLQMLVREWRRKETRTIRALPQVDTILIGGGSTNSALRIGAKQVFPNARLVEAYGMTETASSMTFLEAGGTPDIKAWTGLVGRPAIHVQLRVFDQNTGQHCPTMVVGEIATKGPHVMLGYWGSEEETSRAVRNGWLFTGDLGFLDEKGNLVLKGRIKDMIKTGGENVYAIEVESVLLLHPRVSACAVFGLPDLKYSEIVCAAVEVNFRREEEIVLENDEHIAIGTELTQLCREKLSAYKVPKKIFLLKDLPRNAVGKIVKDKLKQRLLHRL